MNRRQTNRKTLIDLLLYNHGNDALNIRIDYFYIISAAVSRGELKVILSAIRTISLMLRAFQCSW